MKVPPGGFVERHLRLNRQFYPVLAYQWVDPDRSGFGHDPIAGECLEAYRAVANLMDRLKPKVMTGCGWTVPHEDVEVFDPWVDKVWTVSGSLIEDFELAALNLHGDPDIAGLYQAA